MRERQAGESYVDDGADGGCMGPVMMLGDETVQVEMNGICLLGD